MRDKKTIKRELLDRFREIDAECGDPLDPEWLHQGYLEQLKRPERQLYRKAVAELAAMGIIEKEPGDGPILRLTLKGEKLIGAGGLRRPERSNGPDAPLFGFTGTDG